MSRGDIPEDDRRDFSIIIDEFQNYATPSIATFLRMIRSPPTVSETKLNCRCSYDEMFGPSWDIIL